MARTGRFGRQPRAAQNLTNTLIAIAREAERQRDQNLMDAWQKGGMFEGQKATDELVLAHWKERMEGVSKDDPLYDTYKNAHEQLDYQIHESKMTAAYAQHKKTDAQMIAFYLGWAKKVPKNSEFYRVLQRDAGQYMRANKAASQAAANAAKEKAYEKAQTDTYNTRERASEYITDVLRRMAQSGNADAGLGQLIAGPGSGSDFTGFDPSDPAAMLKLIELITPTTRTEGTIDVGEPGGARKPTSTESSVAGGILYHDDSGNPVTGQDVLDVLAKYDPSFKPGQKIDLEYISDLAQTQIKGLDERIERAKKTGHMTDVNNLEKQKAYFAMIGREKNAWPIQQSYNIARSQYDSVVADRSSSPQAILKAWDTYRNTLITLSKDPSIAADDATRSRLIGEANGDAGAPTLHESFTGLADGQFDGTATDAAENARAIEFMQKQVDLVKGGGAVWTNGVYNQDGTFTPQAGGPSIGAADPNPILTGNSGAKVIYVPDARGEGAIPVLMQGIPIKAVAHDANGQTLHATDANPLGMAYDIIVGGTTKTVYGFDIQNPDGTTKTVYSTDPPWNENAQVQNVGNGGNHIEVTLDRFVPQVDAAHSANGPVPGVTGWYVQGAKQNAATGKWEGGELNYQPAAATFASDERNSLGTGGFDPNTDFFSPTLAALMSDKEGQAILKDLDHNPTWKAQLQADAYQYAGYKPDPATPGAWLPGDAAAQARFNEAMGQATRVQNTSKALASGGEFLQGLYGAWQRVTTGSPFKGGQTSGGGDAFGQVTKLATDMLQGTPFEALGNAFHLGTNLLKPAPNSSGSPDDRMLDIAPKGTITVPTYTGIPYKPPVVTTPGTAAQTQISTYTPPSSTQTYAQPAAATNPYLNTTKAKNLEYI